jgi:type II secretory ATPase GspE/PulE/Tfp pilus assembly ATPase PilB-like protein
MVTKQSTAFENRVARVLVDGGFITNQQVEEAERLSQEKGTGLLDALVSQGWLTRDTLVTVLSLQLRVPVADLRNAEIDPKGVALVPEEYAREHQILPLGFGSDGSLRIATRSPNDFQLSTELASMTGRQVRFALALGEGLEALINRVYSGAPLRAKPAEPEAEPGTAVTAAPAEPGAGPLAKDISQLPAVQAVEMVTLQAVKRSASDVHMVPTPDSSRVLFRIDGVLQQMTVLPLTLHETMVSRIKLQANLDISEKRRPQDGSFTMQFGERAVDFRVSSVGTVWGEMLVMRVLDRSGRLLALQEVGLDSTALQATRQLLALPHGMLMVSGPTGSGKTTTLYATITELVRERGNIMTIEDPVEYRMEDLNQVEVNREAGIDFATGLRSIMRLDPDVILVGEMRDAETAKTGVNAALTGHLVLTSIHANDSSSAIVRLLDLVGEPYLVATSIMGSIAQRLVRKICSHCRLLTELSDAESIVYEQEMQEPAGEFWVGQGCNFCGDSGFSGRTGVFEVLVVGERIRELIVEGASGQDIRNQALAEGMIPLRRAGFLKAKEGVTTVREVLRNVYYVD